MAEPFESLRGQLLVSLPSMQEDYFAHSVTLLLEHNEEGAFGVVVNRPLEPKLAEVLKEHDIACARDITLLEGGPVEQGRLFFLHSGEVDYETSHRVNEQLSFTTSADLEDIISKKTGPKDIIAGLGYAGWAGGQLESEIIRDVWLVAPFAYELIFVTPYDDRPQAAARQIGIDLNLIAPTPGHG